jgi:hypothetical protein
VARDIWSVVSGHGYVSSLTAERDAERADDPDLAQFLFDEGQLVAEELRGRPLGKGCGCSRRTSGSPAQPTRVSDYPQGTVNHAWQLPCRARKGHGELLGAGG